MTMRRKRVKRLKLFPKNPKMMRNCNLISLTRTTKAIGISIMIKTTKFRVRKKNNHKSQSLVSVETETSPNRRK